jgi:uncharacterized GH25 family protein
MMSRPSSALMFRRLGRVAAAAVILSVAPPLFAHDMWIDPTTFFPEPGTIVGLRLRVGENLLGDPLPRDPSLINQFVFEDESGRKPVIGRDGADPAGLLRAATPGLLVVGYRSNPSAIEQTPEKFNQYLKEEGLDAVAALRARRKETGVKAREMFSRCAKSLLLTGPAAAGQGDRLLGLPLEIVAERNPYMTAIGQELPFRLIYENRPLPGTLVVAMNRLNPAEKLRARTDNDGRVRFTLTRGGMWLVKAVHMVPAPDRANAEWASYWASLTFGLKDTL